jgi:hypothetical protein
MRAGAACGGGGGGGGFGGLGGLGGLAVYSAEQRGGLLGKLGIARAGLPHIDLAFGLRDGARRLINRPEPLHLLRIHAA